MTSILSATSSLRIGGLASGIDTDSIIKELMKAHRIPLDRLNQDKQILLWKQEDYRAIYDSLRAFRDKVFNMKLQATYQAKKASSSNEAAVSASATTSAVPGIYKIVVNQLAEGASATSSVKLVQSSDSTKTVDPTKPLNTQLAGLDPTYTFTINGSKEITVDTAVDSLNTVIAKINGATRPDGSALGVKASYDQNLGRVFLVTTGTGADKKIYMNDNKYGTGPGNFFEKVFSIDAMDEASTTYVGKNAVFSLNGVGGLEQSTNTFTVAGITYELKSTTDANGVNVTVSSDTDAVFNAIKYFVDAYNEIIDKINGKLTEPRYRDYLPLTDEQREQLSEEQEKQWEEKARSGLLRGDSLLESVVSRMRTTMSAIVPGLAAGYDTLADVGITTLSYEERGKLYIDEARLKDALQKDPDGVMNLFTKSAENYAEKGIAMRLYDDVNSAMALISDRAGTSSSYSTADNSAIGRQIAAVNERISTMEERLQQLEDRYWRQFTAMEQAIQQMNAQSAWLAQVLGTGQTR